MNIELLPFNAFALESVAPSAVAASVGQTLTLQGGLGPVLAAGQGMGGTASAGGALPMPGAMRAEVLGASATAWTLTF